MPIFKLPTMDPSEGDQLSTNLTGIAKRSSGMAGGGNPLADRAAGGLVPRANFPTVAGVNPNPWVDYINQHNSAVDAHQRRMAGYDEGDRAMQQQIQAMMGKYMPLQAQIEAMSGEQGLERGDIENQFLPLQDMLALRAGQTNVEGGELSNERQRMGNEAFPAEEWLNLVTGRNNATAALDKNRIDAANDLVNAPFSYGAGSNDPITAGRGAGVVGLERAAGVEPTTPTTPTPSAQGQGQGGTPGPGATPTPTPGATPNPNNVGAASTPMGFWGNMTGGDPTGAAGSFAAGAVPAVAGGAAYRVGSKLPSLLGRIGRGAMTGAEEGEGKGGFWGPAVGMALGALTSGLTSKAESEIPGVSDVEKQHPLAAWTGNLAGYPLGYKASGMNLAPSASAVKGFLNTPLNAPKPGGFNMGEPTAPPAEWNQPPKPAQPTGWEYGASAGESGVPPQAPPPPPANTGAFEQARFGGGGGGEPPAPGSAPTPTAPQPPPTPPQPQGTGPIGASMFNNDPAINQAVDTFAQEQGLPAPTRHVADQFNLPLADVEAPIPQFNPFPNAAAPAAPAAPAPTQNVGEPSGFNWPNPFSPGEVAAQSPRDRTLLELAKAIILGQNPGPHTPLQ